MLADEWHLMHTYTQVLRIYLLFLTVLQKTLQKPPAASTSNLIGSSMAAAAGFDDDDPFCSVCKH
jgi:hypothetical protein